MSLRLSRYTYAAASLALAACATEPAPAPASHVMEAPKDPSMASPPRTDLRGYLSPTAVDGLAVLGPPPEMSSPVGQADRATYLATRSMAGTPRWVAAQRDNDLWFGGALKRLSCAMGKEVSEATTPTTLRLLERVELDVRTVGSPVKDKYNRKRPMIDDERVICVPREDWMKTNGSYPSGHSGTGWGWGLVLGEAVPSKASALAAAGREIGDSRTICGVHYQSDVEAGRTLASVMVTRLHGEPAFVKDLARAKRELARAPAPANCPTG